MFSQNLFTVDNNLWKCNIYLKAKGASTSTKFIATRCRLHLSFSCLRSLLINEKQKRLEWRQETN